MEYKVLTTNKGFRYMKGSRFCKKEDVPEDILQRLLTQETIDTSKDCPFCGQPGTEEKTLNSHRYLLCLDDYNTKTTGELAELLLKTPVSI